MMAEHDQLLQMQEELNSCSDLQLLKAHVEKHREHYRNELDSNHHKSENTVLWDGKLKSPIMLIGEAPGITEDETKIPFSPSGDTGRKLVEKYLKPLGLDRNHVFLTNTFFWRPYKPIVIMPYLNEDREPTVEEHLKCRPIIHKLIQIVNPIIIILIGKSAARYRCWDYQPLSSVTVENQRGTELKLYNYNPIIKMIATYHPSSLNRNPQHPIAVEQDIKLVRTFINEFKGTCSVCKGKDFYPIFVGSKHRCNAPDAYKGPPFWSIERCISSNHVVRSSFQ